MSDHQTLGTEWLTRASDYAATWSDYTLHAVTSAFPYDPPRGIRMTDWVELVAHVSLAKEEDPIQAAERLASYARTYAERYGTPTPSPEKLAASQLPHDRY